jgi:hypothetical protein
MYWPRSAAHTKCAQRSDDEAVLRRDLFQEMLHYTRVRPSGGAVYCTLVLVCRSEAEEEFKNRNARLQRQRLGSSSNGWKLSHKSSLAVTPP